ncbi:hypothetical protein BC835DRAFT_1302793 [Cytidiella melzeri]|nr:hypothetical protein BC835DRAFT_1302793 [Cytidiella melzeri]
MQASGYEFKLHRIIYHGDNQFNCFIIDNNGHIWFHDGIHTGRHIEYNGHITGIDVDVLMTDVTLLSPKVWEFAYKWTQMETCYTPLHSFMSCKCAGNKDFQFGEELRKLWPYY